MRIPYLTIFVNDKDDLVMSHVNRPSGDPFDVERPLKELSARGLDEASKGIGRVVLALMANWYPQQMQKYPELAVPYDEESDMYIITSLVSKCSVGRTKVHLASIEALIEEVLRQKPEMATLSPTIANWPDIRERIEKNSN